MVFRLWDARVWNCLNRSAQVIEKVRDGLKNHCLDSYSFGRLLWRRHGSVLDLWEARVEHRDAFAESLGSGRTRQGA